MDANVIVVIGNLTGDPELRHTPGGKAVCKFSIANNQREDQVHYFDVKVWEKTAEVCQEYLQKGNKVCVTGQLHQERWDAKDGGKRSRVVINGHLVQFLTPKGGDAPAKQSLDDEPPF